jgi:hypothetical protein
MNDGYVTEFRTFRDEFRIFKESTYTTDDPALMNQEWLNPAFFGGSGTRGEGSYAASLSSSSQRATPILTPSSDSASAIARAEAAADEEATNGKGGDDLKDGEDLQVTGTDDSPASGIRQPSQRSRKGHKKSRQGCYNCKRRKIKVRLSGIALEGT